MEITLDELDQQGVAIDLSPVQARLLKGSGLVEVVPTFEGLCRITPNGKVGAVAFEEVQIQVLPKGGVGIGHVLFLLGYALDPSFNPTLIAGQESKDIWPAIAETLSRLSEKALGTGVLQGYRTRDDSLRTVRGRIRISDHISRNFGQMIPIEVTHDEYTTDIAENRILRTAIRRVLSVPRMPAKQISRLQHLDNLLSSVAVLPPGSGLPKWIPSRLNDRYMPALQLSQIILQNNSPDLGVGSGRMAGFVVNMAKVFEDFCSVALRESLQRYPGMTTHQYRAHLDVGDAGRPGRLAIYPDVVHEVNRRPHLIFDAKYKAIAPGGTASLADHYQMLAYCTALDVQQAWLVYAGGHKIEHYKVRNSDVTISEYPLQLQAEPQRVLKQVDTLVDMAWTARTR